VKQRAGGGWGRIREMVRKEFRQLFRDPRSKRLVFGAPVLQLLLLGYAVNTDVRNTRLFVVDHDRTAASGRLVDALTAGGYFRVAGASDSPAALTTALDRGRTTLGLEIPAGYARDLGSGRGARVLLLVDGTSSNTATIAQANALRIIQQHALDLAAAATPLPAGGIELRTRAWYNPELASRAYNIPAVIGAILLLMSLLLTAMAVVREREVGTLEQLMVSPLTPGELMLGKTIPVAAIAMVDLALIAVIGILWFEVPFRGSVPDLILASLLFVLAGLAIGLLVSTVSATQQEAFMVMFLLLLPTLILSGLLYPVETMPPFFAALALLNPLRHFLEVVRGIFLKGQGVADLWPQYLFMFVFAGVVLRAAVWRFRRTL
jgi:ABC-2 type transport system permease protein